MKHAEGVLSCSSNMLLGQSSHRRNLHFSMLIWKGRWKRSDKYEETLGSNDEEIRYGGIVNEMTQFKQNCDAMIKKKAELVQWKLWWSLV